ncbi:MAG: SDR family NAD(P)-dependent oxidoreductase [Candidatus Aminicenantes bacterium]|nr:SDR family NAD(P)-dependent oxidoreductase [Candidatus Aminicenantes bacterium]
MNNKTKDYALITGGSEGIGKAFAEECAVRGMNLIIAALPGPSLINSGEYFRKTYGVDVETLGINLTEKDAPQRLFDFCRDKGLRVRLLVNNAGLAGSAVFAKSSLEEIDKRIQLNIRAMVFLTRLFIPSMKELDSAYILNIGSLGGYFAIPYKSLYTASKAFVLVFTKALREELKNTGISVGQVCPNGVRTNIGSHARIDSHGFIGRLTQVPADKIARLSLRKFFKGKSLIIPGFVNKVLLFLGKVFPERIQQKILFREFRKELAADDWEK